MITTAMNLPIKREEIIQKIRQLLDSLITGELKYLRSQRSTFINISIMPLFGILGRYLYKR